jgi:putative membrane protein
MNASPTGQTLPSNEASPDCGPGGGRGWGLWPIVPLVIIGAILLLVGLAWAIGGTGGRGGPGPFFWPIFPLGFFLFVLVSFVAIRFAFWGRGWGGPRYWSGMPSAEEVLRRRYARGEISEEEYRERLRVLRSSGA